jgi:hypothetical protein
MLTLRSVLAHAARRSAPAAVAAALLTSWSFAAPAAPRFEGLKPGEFVTQQLKVPVRIVLIGFEDLAVDETTIRAILPASYDPVVRYPRYYGLSGRALGLHYDFGYTIVQKNPAFAKRFFSYLASVGREGPQTFFQTLYNAQARNLLDVTPNVLYVDAPSVERWLEANDRRDERGYTIYLVNWYGRDDFRFHVYTKTDEPDPDTHLNFGERYDSLKLAAWGGSSGRTWLYDFSAGPEWNGGNWVVDSQDIDGDGEPDYPIPVIWEYSPSGYRAPEQLSSDMGILARFVAINLLFTPSPLYDPLITAPDPLGRKIAHVSMLEDDPDPGQKGAGFFDPAFARAKLHTFQPYYDWRVKLDDRDPIDAGAKQALDIFTGNTVADDCWNAYWTPFAELFCYFDANRSSYVPTYRARDYVAPVFAFNTTDAGLGDQLGLLGLADDNWRDGTQSFVYTFGAPSYRTSGYGFTSTTVHEVGHHIGLSHPHDGYDSEFAFDYGPRGFFYFAWLGDESDTVMHYLSLSGGFGEHNRDNMYRWEAAGFLNWSNALAGDILASPKAGKVSLMLLAADRMAKRASEALQRWDYLAAVGHARFAYGTLTGAARSIGVGSPTIARALRALPPERIEKYVCRPRPLEH